MISICKESQLFIDDYLIEEKSNIIKTLHQPEKYEYNPILTYDRPWEGTTVIIYGTVLYDEEDKIFKMWYQTHNKNFYRSENTYVCYATSIDGITWEKPELGIIKYRGTKKNNIVLESNGVALDSPCVLKDSDDVKPDPEKRYKMVIYEARTDKCPSGIYAAFSPDGKHWQKTHSPIITKCGDRRNLMYDFKQNKYLLFMRLTPEMPRIIGLAESKDFLHWRKLSTILRADSKDLPDDELYSMVGFNYESIYLGFLEMFHVRTRKLDLQLTSSRDGYIWERTEDRNTFVPYGSTGDFDSCWVAASCNPPFLKEDKLWLWYSGRSTLHWDLPVSKIGLLTLRKDGFVSVDAGNKEGVLLTKPLKFTGNQLYINAKAEKGIIKAEVTDQEGRIIKGYSKEACSGMQIDEINHPICWVEHPDLAPLADKHIRIRFYVRNAELYSFKII